MANMGGWTDIWALRLGGLLLPLLFLGTAAAPMISILRQPAVGDTETSLLCHVEGFFPKEVDVVWLRDGQVLKGFPCSSPQRNLDGTFTFTMTYTFTPTHKDAGSVFSCRVHHMALRQPLKEDIPLDIRGSTEVDHTSTMISAVLGIGIITGIVVITIMKQKSRSSRQLQFQDDPGPAPVRSPVLRPPGWAVSYSVSEVQGPERCLLGQEVTLSCSMEGTFPEDVAVTWERIHSKDRMVPEIDKEQESSEHQTLLPALPPGWRVTEEKADTRFTSSLTFTPTLQDDRARVRCCFLHKVESIKEERVSPEIQVWAQPQVSEIQVLPEWDPRDKVPFAVQLHNFYPREVPQIQWGCDGIWSWGEDPAQVDNNADGTFTATSIWRLPSWSLTRPELRVRVCIQHSPGEPPRERELSLRAAGLLQPPEVSEISQPESMATGKGVTLRCHITGHFPGELSVTWLRKGKGEATAVILEDSAECRVEPGMAVLARDGKSFQQQTGLTCWMSRDQGAEYICRVGHLAL
ncbi:hypothetical protein Y1Q_0020623 [Alligator mississippiensis]|uniref:Ig-like domain-containing protein n=1 Tax=Alligator mississippiensis TaxID=8496 RepID=A0A151MVR6_ALLMI|nr:hypothetical protein Y1Q_0020623 [Alligator mississippiensis]